MRLRDVVLTSAPDVMDALFIRTACACVPAAQPRSQPQPQPHGWYSLGCWSWTCHGHTASEPQNFMGFTQTSRVSTVLTAVTQCCSFSKCKGNWTWLFGEKYFFFQGTSVRFRLPHKRFSGWYLGSPSKATVSVTENKSLTYGKLKVFTPGKS